MLSPETDKHPKPSVEVHHLVGKLSMAETLLRCNVKFLVINVCNQGKNLCSPCITQERLKIQPNMKHVEAHPQFSLHVTRIKSVVGVTFRPAYSCGTGPLHPFHRAPVDTGTTVNVLEEIQMSAQVGHRTLIVRSSLT